MNDAMICQPLSDLLSSEPLRSFVHAPEFICGVVFGVSAAPEIPMPEQWMPWVVNSSGENILSNQQVDALAEGLIAQLQWQLKRLRNKQSLFPTNIKWSDEQDERVKLQNWLSGLLFAHTQLESVWLNAWQKAPVQDDESRLKRCLKCFSVLANSEVTLASLEQDKRHSLQKNLPVLFAQLEGLLADYVCLADELASSLPGQFELYKQAPSFDKKH